MMMMMMRKPNLLLLLLAAVAVMMSMSPMSLVGADEVDANSNSNVNVNVNLTDIVFDGEDGDDEVESTLTAVYFIEDNEEEDLLEDEDYDSEESYSPSPRPTTTTTTTTRNHHPSSSPTSSPDTVAAPQQSDMAPAPAAVPAAVETRIICPGVATAASGGGGGEDHQFLSNDNGNDVGDGSSSSSSFSYVLGFRYAVEFSSLDEDYGEDLDMPTTTSAREVVAQELIHHRRTLDSVEMYLLERLASDMLSCRHHHNSIGGENGGVASGGGDGDDWVSVSVVGLDSNPADVVRKSCTPRVRDDDVCLVVHSKMTVHLEFDDYSSGLRGDGDNREVGGGARAKMALLERRAEAAEVAVLRSRYLGLTSVRSYMADDGLLLSASSSSLADVASLRYVGPSPGTEPHAYDVDSAAVAGGGGGEVGPGGAPTQGRYVDDRRRGRAASAAVLGVFVSVATLACCAMSVHRVRRRRAMERWQLSHRDDFDDDDSDDEESEGDYHGERDGGNDDRGGSRGSCSDVGGREERTYGNGTSQTRGSSNPRRVKKHGKRRRRTTTPSKKVKRVGPKKRKDEARRLKASHCRVRWTTPPTKPTMTSIVNDLISVASSSSSGSSGNNEPQAERLEVPGGMDGRDDYRVDSSFCLSVIPEGSCEDASSRCTHTSRVSGLSSACISVASEIEFGSLSSSSVTAGIVGPVDGDTNGSKDLELPISRSTLDDSEIC